MECKTGNETVGDGHSPSAQGSLSDWFESVPGRYILEQEIALAEDIVANLFGYQLVLVGSPDYGPVLRASRVLQRTIVDVVGSGTVDGRSVPSLGAVAESTDSIQWPIVRGEPGALPIGSDSVDVVVLPHVLEFVATPHETLREAERMLVGEGHMILTGFNPRGFMGLWRACLRRRSGAPWSGQFFATNRIKDWLALLGFDIVGVHNVFFRPPFGNERILERMRFLEGAGRRFWPYLSGAYVIVAQKRLTTVTPIRPRWRQRRLVSVGIAEPTSRASVSKVVKD